MANMPLTDIGITPRKASQFASKGIETVTDCSGIIRPNTWISGILSRLRKENIIKESMLPSRVRS